jgi:hypothetical protein
MKQKHLLLVSMLGLSLILSYGCAALLIGGAAGAGAVAYVSGELKSTE